MPQEVEAPDQPRSVDAFRLILALAGYLVEQELALDEPLQIRENEIERPRRIELEIIGRRMRRNDEVGRPPQGRAARQRLGIEHVEHGAEPPAFEMWPERVVIDQMRAAVVDEAGSRF